MSDLGTVRAIQRRNPVGDDASTAASGELLHVGLHEDRMRGRTVSSSRPLQRLLRGNLTERFGRFRTVRRAYSALRRHQQGDRAYYRDRLKPRSTSLFSPLNVDRCVAEIADRAYAASPPLTSEMTAHIYDFARAAACTEPGQPRHFRLDEVIDGRLGGAGGRDVYRALVENPTECPQVQKLVRDPQLLDIVRRYLGYWPDRITAHLVWSIASDRPIATSQQHYPPANFHYDIAGHNFMTAYFYITSVERVEDGAHLMIPGSHGSKPIALLGSGRHSDAAIDAHYGLDSAIPILGRAGFGFIQDPSCIHRVEPPRANHRLLLQLRYS